MKFFIKTFGCQMNVSDSEKISQILSSNQLFTQTNNIDKSDLIIVNTCSVRKHAEDRAESFIGELKKLKIKNPKLKVIIVGCYAQKSKLELKKKFPYIDYFIGTLEYDYLPEILSEILKTNLKFNTNLKIKNNNISTFVPIMTGCNNYCSYCIVPYVRGKEKSRPVNEILDEIKLVLQSGVKEITLLGQNVNSYLDKTEDGKNITFAKLLEKIVTTNFSSHNFWLRFMTNHPKDMTKEIVYTIKKYPNICKHIHLPLQSGSDKILSLMNRKYTSKQYFDLVQMIRDIIPEISITTDLIVGFPSETEEDFMQTYNLVKKIKFDFAFVFKYSVREGTKAAEFYDDVSKEIKEKRHFKLLSLCESIAKKVNYKYINNTYQGLIFDKKAQNKYYARLESNRVVELKTDKQLEIGSFVNIKIVDIKKHNLIGSLVN